MSESDIVKWDGRYRDSTACASIEPDPELLEAQSLIPRGGTVLDLACGLGKNALYLARQGCSVTAVDGSVEALHKLEAAARAFGLGQRIEGIQADLDDYSLPVKAFDLVLVVRYLNRALFADIDASLRAGGVLIYKTFNRNILKERPGFNPDYTIETEELLNAFPGLEVVSDNRGETSEYAFMVGRKPC